MGFYSFYKIIKDIIRTIFGNRAFRLVLIACICGFLLCFVSDKVQATFEGDTHGIFDTTIPIPQNANNFDLGVGNSKINVKLPTFIWNYDNIFVAYSYETSGNSTNYCKIIFSSNNLYFSFNNNMVYYDGNSSSYYYWLSITIENGVADFSEKQLNDFTLNVGSTGFFNPSFTFASNYENYTALYGKIYQKNTNALILDSSSLVEEEEQGELIYYANNKEGITFNLYHLKDYYFYFVCTYRYTDRNTDYYTYQLLVCDNEFTVDKSLNTPSFIIPTGSKFYQGFGSTSNLTNLQNTINTLTLSSTPTNQITYINYLTDMATAYNTISLSSAKVATNFDIKNENNSTEFPDYFIQNPYFEPSDTEIQALTWDNIFVELGDFDIDNNDLYIHRLEVSHTVVGTGADEPISYYYNDNTIKLKKGGKYWRQLFDLEQYYFSVPMSQFGFKPEKAYFLILTNNSDSITSSLGKVNENYYNTIYQIVEINSGNLITLEDVMNNNIEKMGDDVTFLGRTIEESLAIGSENNKQITEETDEVIDTNLNFNNNTGLDNIYNGFFSRLTSTLTTIFDYNPSQVDIITLPVKDQNIQLRSDMISAYIPSSLYTIIQAMWYFIFNFYLFKYISNLYYSLKSGGIIDGFKTEDDIILKSML